MIDRLDKQDRVVILTGAGISAESGIQTFRASDGLWENHRIENVATPYAHNTFLTQHTKLHYAYNYLISCFARTNTIHLYAVCAKVTLVLIGSCWCSVLCAV